MLSTRYPHHRRARSPYGDLPRRDNRLLRRHPPPRRRNLRARSPREEERPSRSAASKPLLNSKQETVDCIAYAMQREQVYFLDARGAVRGDADMNVVRCEDARDLAAIASGE